MLFEKATRLKLRFNTNVGMLAVEDLWDLSLPGLNDLAKSLNRDIKESKETDFLKEISTEDTVTKLQFDIVLHVLNTKKSEADERKNAAVRKEKKEKLLAILARKQDSALEDMSEDDIKKMLEEL